MYAEIIDLFFALKSWITGVMIGSVKILGLKHIGAWLCGTGKREGTPTGGTAGSEFDASRRRSSNERPGFLYTYSVYEKSWIRKDPSRPLGYTQKSSKSPETLS